MIPVFLDLAYSDFLALVDRIKMLSTKNRLQPGSVYRVRLIQEESDVRILFYSIPEEKN